jgi:hypothetical protein
MIIKTSQRSLQNSLCLILIRDEFVVLKKFNHFSIPRRMMTFLQRAEDVRILWVAKKEKGVTARVRVVYKVMYITYKQRRVQPTQGPRPLYRHVILQVRSRYYGIACIRHSQGW